MLRDPRTAIIEDRAAVEAIVAAAYAPWVPRIGREPGPMGDDYGALIRAGRVRVVERDGAMRGVLVLIPEAEAMLLDNVAVVPEAQGKGLGRALLAVAERAAIGAGYRRIRLYTNEAMAGNVALYARLGYAETHRGEEAGLRRVYMTKALGPAADG